MDNNRLPAAGGLRKKLFLLCSLLVIIASMAFALIGILQLRASARVAAETIEVARKVSEKRAKRAKRFMRETFLDQNSTGQFFSLM